MFIDASALHALLAREPRAADIRAALNDALAAHQRLFTSPIAVFETVTSLASKFAGPNRPVAPELFDDARRAVAAFLEDFDVKVTPIMPDIGEKALDAARRFHKRSGSPAALNFGDCFAYACAKAYRAPILFVGRDFQHTDLAGVLKNADPDA